jgi:hypothetical protein
MVVGICRREQEPGILSSWPLPNKLGLSKWVDFGTDASVWSISMVNGSKGLNPCIASPNPVIRYLSLNLN